MTGPVTTEALRDALARSAIEAKFGPEGVAVIFDTPDEATDHQRTVLVARAEEARRVADFAIAGPLAPLLAAHQQQAASIGSLEGSVNGLEAALQQVTAERDAARKEASDLQNDWADEVAASRRETERADAAEASLATATSELARLRAEGEAKDRALKPFADYADFAERHEWPKNIAEDPTTPVLGGASETACEVTVGDFRAARAATAREGA